MSPKPVHPPVSPLGDRVLLRRIPPDERKGSILIPETAREKPQECEALAVGPGKMSDTGVRLPMEVAVGDRVLVAKYSGHEIRHEGEDYLVIREGDCQAVLQ